MARVRHVKIFVINLDRSPDRREAIFARLGELGLTATATRFPAIDGATLSEAEQGYNGRKRRLFYGKDLTLGEIGCARSHLGVYAEMERCGIDHALVLEDDALIDDTLPAALDAIAANSGDWDMVRFLPEEKNLSRARPVKDLGHGFTLCRVYGTPGGAHAYVLNRTAAIRLLKAGKILWRPIDTLHGQIWAHGLRIRCISPCPVAQNLDYESTIGDKRFERKTSLKGWEPLAFPFARLSFKCFDAITKHGTLWLGNLQDRLGKLGTRQVPRA